jgi:hypothetical protein
MNIKQTVLSVITVSFAIFFTLATAYAQEATTVPANVPSPTPIDYQLPYPGMLPDNPLYFLKMFRDNLTAFFLSKPLDKANFDLLQSDKNVQASYLLVTQHQGKTELAFKTFSQAQDYFDQAITQTMNAKKQGYSTKEIADKLVSSNQKHVQILQALAQQAHQTNSQTVKQERSRAEAFTKQVKSL